MKQIYKFVFIFLFAALNLQTIAQPGTWTWIHGDSIINAPGNFGTQGIPSPSNKPPAIYEPAEFIDQQGNFWIFGGLYGAFGYNDLWKYDPVLNQWTWMKGSGILGNLGNYGTQGVPALSNLPPDVTYGVNSWVDNNGDFWIFGGGNQNGFIGDLWKYTILNNTWTWMNGTGIVNQAAVYGTQGIPSSTNTPGARAESNASWVDNNNNLWLFGGQSFLGDLNDLWKYDPLLNQWTWMTGANFIGQPGVYGTQGIANSTNVPGARWAYGHWKDGNGNFWFFGGYTKVPDFVYNDMWMYNPTTNYWTWVSGPNQANVPAIFGTQCLPSINNLPTPRYENRSCWIDNNGKFWMYGGSAKLIPNGGLLGDLWIFNPASLEWVFVSGDSISNQLPVFGFLSLPSLNNKPGGRMGAVAWYNNANYIFLFGGLNQNNYVVNDLWRYEIDPNCPSFGSGVPSVNFFSSDTLFCDKECLDFFDLSTNNPTSWQWFFPGADTTTSTLQNPTNICYNSYGSFDVTLIACNAVGCDTLTLYNFINEFQLPPVPVVTINFDTLFSSQAYSYQWYFNSVPITGATNQYYVYQQQGSYYVIVTDSNGCASSSNAIGTMVGELGDGSQDILIIPDPNDGHFEILFPAGINEIEYCNIYDVTGRTLFNSGPQKIIYKYNIDLIETRNGIYFIRIKAGNKSWTKKIVVNR